MDKIDTWIENRFGTPNTFNRQLLDNFIEFLEKELGYVRKDDDQSLPPTSRSFMAGGAQKLYGELMLKKNWVKVKEEFNGEG